MADDDEKSTTNETKREKSMESTTENSINPTTTTKNSPAGTSSTKEKRSDGNNDDDDGIGDFSSKRRRKSSTIDNNNETTTNFSNLGVESKLTVENVRDHEKLLENSSSTTMTTRRDVLTNFMAKNIIDQSKGTSSIDVCSSVGSISLDDNLSTMATDGSRQSLQNYVVVDGETKEIPPPPPALEEEDEESVGGIEIAIDSDGTILDPGAIGEPNEPQLSHWEPEYLSAATSSRTSRENPLSFLDDQEEEEDPSNYDDQESTTAPQVFFTPASSTPTGEDDSTSGGGVRRQPPRRHRRRLLSDDDDDDETESATAAASRSLISDEQAAAQLLRKIPPHKWNAANELRRRELGGSFGYNTMSSSPDLFRYRANGALHFVQRLELMYKMEQHDGCVNCLHFNESGTRLASGSDDLQVIVWDWTTKTPLITIDSGHRANVFQAKFMPLSGDCHLVTCARDGQVRLAELSVRGVCKSTRKLAQHRGSSHKLTLESDSPHTFLSCGDDAVVFELDLRDPKPNKILTCKDGRARGGDSKIPLYSIHSNPRNSSYFALSGRDPYCRIYDKRMLQADGGGEAVKKFCPQHLTGDDNKTNVTAVVFSYDGSELIGTYNDDDIYLFDTNQSKETEYKHRYIGHRNNATVKGVNFYGPRSEFIVSGSDCGNIYFWDKESEAIVQFMPGDEGGVVNVLEPHPTCAMLATSGLDHDVKLWVPSNEEPKFDAKLLQKIMRQNAGEREQERRNEPDYIDSQMLWYIMSRMRRAARRAEGENGSDESGADGSDDTDENTDEDGGDDRAPMQCRQS